MNQKYKISIIIPAYNVEKYIEQCLRSIMGQTYKNLEIIVVNDGSKDKTGEIIKRLSEEDERIIFIDKENTGVSDSRNVALKRASSEFIMFVDSDDWLDLDACEVALNEAIKEDADVVMFGYVREYEDKSMPNAMFDEDKIIFDKKDIPDKLHRRIFGLLGAELSKPEKLNANTTIWAKLYKADFARNVEFMNLKELGICEDGYFNIGVFKNIQKVVFIKKYMYHYRKIIDGGSLTQNKEKNVYDDAKKFYNKLNELILKENLSKNYIDAADNRFALCLIERVNGKNINYKNIKKILNDELYRKVIKKLPLKYFPLHWKVFFWCAKVKFTFGVFVLLKIINFLLSIR